MATSQRASLLTKTFTVLKKHYKPQPPVDRPVLDQLIFASCLENANYTVAEQGFLILQEEFFDWNEVRVSTLRDLREALEMLPDPEYAGENIRQLLRHIFEATYDFNCLEELRKKALGKAVKELNRIKGTTSFTVGYITQASLGGHSIPLDKAALEALRVIGAASEAEAAKGNVSGVERAIAKSKGPDFASLLHEFSADYLASPTSTKLQKVFQEINPEAKERLPGRSRSGSNGKKKAAKGKTAKKAAKKKASPAKAAAKKSARKKTAAKKAPGKRKKPR